ncbi:MAG: hypothetical protein MUC95_01525 [Spirochaetes bacterium]|nr:hypothetical protein [Spirochaetota bacterium]
MKKTITIFMISSFVYLTLINSSYSKTTITTTGLATQVTNFDSAYSSILDDFDATARRNGPLLANAFSLANLIGYPIGKAYLGSLPHFELGLAAGAGCQI